MKDIPTEITKPFGPWLKRINELMATININEPRQHVIDTLGEPDIRFTKGQKAYTEYQDLGLDIYISDEEPDEMLIFKDPFRPNRYYVFEIRSGIITQKYQHRTRQIGSA